MQYDRAMDNTPPLPRRLLAELLGSAFLAAVVIGSGIAAQTLSPNDVGLQLFENAAATAAGLAAIIFMFGPVSGAHFNPVVSLADASFGGIAWRDVLGYVPVQTVGCVLGAVTANGMFSLTAVSISTHHRASPADLLSEAIATAGLLLVIFSLARTKRATAAPAAIGAYIGAAYFFTSSTSFANPAITVGAHVLQHVRRHRAGLGPGICPSPARRWRRRRRVAASALPDKRAGEPPLEPWLRHPRGPLLSAEKSVSA